MGFDSKSWIYLCYQGLRLKHNKGKIEICDEWAQGFSSFKQSIEMPTVPSKPVLLPYQTVHCSDTVEWQPHPVCQYCNKGHAKEAKCLAKSKYYDSILTKEFLVEHYVEQKKSTVQIAEEIGIYFGVIHKKLQTLGLNRTIQESSVLQNKIDRRTKTYIDKYGVPHNFCKDSESRKAWEQRLLYHEGITNVFQREDVKKKIKKALLERYEYESPEVTHSSKGRVTYSRLNRRVADALSLKGVQFFIEKKLSRDDIRYYSYDLCMGDRLVEINGDYWHGNPQIYGPDDIVLKGSSRELTVGEIWEKDAAKLQFAVDAGYKVLVVWEKDIKQNFEIEIDKVAKWLSSQE